MGHAVLPSTEERLLRHAMDIARAVPLHQQHKLSAAARIYQSILNEDPDHFDALNLLGVILVQARQSQAAQALFERALQQQPQHPDVLVHLGCAVQQEGRFDEAMARFDQALAVNPDHVEAWFNRGQVFLQTNRLTPALACFDQALALDPENPTAHDLRCITLILGGDFERGWEAVIRGHEQGVGHACRRPLPQDLWLGDEPLAGKRILLHSELGLGDAIQYARYAAMVARQGATVFLEVQPELAGLMCTLAGVSQVIARGDPLPYFDLQAPLHVLPYAFRTRAHDIPSAPAYLSAEADKLQAWSTWLGPRRGLRVGFACTGNPTHDNDHHRSVALGRFLQALPPGCEAVSLQYEHRPGDLPALQAHPEIRHPGHLLEDFTDTAALCELMDVVVSVDTSVAHVAAAIGRPTWILLPFAPDYRWQLDRTDSPWYPTARLYRLPSYDDWDSALARVRADLQALMA